MSPSDVFAKEGIVQLQEVFDASSSQKLASSLVFKKLDEPLLERLSHASVPDGIVNHLATIARHVCQKDLRVVSARAIKLEWKNYRMILDTEQATQTQYDCILELSSPNEKAGGSVVFGNAQDNWRVHAPCGTCTIVKRDTSLQYFYDYMNHYTKEPRMFIHVILCEVLTK
jgi:hypothetical protein